MVWKDSAMLTGSEGVVKYLQPTRGVDESTPPGLVIFHGFRSLDLIQTLVEADRLPDCVEAFCHHCFKTFQV